MPRGTGSKCGCSARGEYVSYQLSIENAGRQPLQAIHIRPQPFVGPGAARIGRDCTELFQNWYARNARGKWQPAYCVPIEGTAVLAIPQSIKRLPEQQNQTVYVNVYIPKNSRPGQYAGSVVVSAGEESEVELPISLEVFDFALPDRLSFWPELNGYHIPQPPYDYYRLAHQHRCVLNCMVWRPRLRGSGRKIRVEWEEYDREAGPLLDGEAFARNRRAGVPVECMVLPFADDWPTPLDRETYRYQGSWPGKGGRLEEIVAHYRTGPYIANGLSGEYKDAFLAVQRQFIEHFAEKGYNQTEMQCFFGGKATHRLDYGANRWWTTEEPCYWDDWLAVQFFQHLWASGRGDADPRIWAARADISRPQWQGRTLNGIVDAVYYGAGGFTGQSMVRRCQTLAEDSGLNVRAYGSANPDAESNTETVSTLLAAWADGADAFLPWQTLGADRSLDQNDAGAEGGNAILVPGNRFDLGAVADMRLKAFRDGQQLIEYLTLLCERRRLTREQVKAMLCEALQRGSRADSGATVDEAEAMELGTLTAWQLSEIRRGVAELIETGGNKR